MKFKEFLLEASELERANLPEHLTSGLNISSWNPALISLKGCPKTIDGNFDCSYNALTSLKYCPTLSGKISGAFDCTNNKLRSLQFCPEHINGAFTCTTNNLTTLLYGPKTVLGNYDCGDNYLENIDGLPEQITGRFYMRNSDNLKSFPALRFLKIKNLLSISTDFRKVDVIINQYLPNTRGNDAIIECQNELLDAGLDDFAQL